MSIPLKRAKDTTFPKGYKITTLIWTKQQISMKSKHNRFQLKPAKTTKLASELKGGWGRALMSRSHLTENQLIDRPNQIWYGEQRIFIIRLVATAFN